MEVRLTQQQFAEAIGVSYRTVSRVFNNHPHVSPATRDTVLQSACRLGFRHHPGARGLRMKKTFTIGMILQNEPLYFWSRILARLEGVLRDQGYYLVICHRRSEASGSEAELRYLQDRDVDGIILVPSPNERAGSIRPFCRSETPLLMLDQRVRGVAAHFLGTDSCRGSRSLCEHLLGLGHERIAFVSGPRTQHTSAYREKGYREAMAAAGVSTSRQVVFHAVGWTREEGERAARHLLGLKRRPTAVISANDILALGVHMQFRQRGVAIPGDISLAGYAGEQDGELVTPSLTTVSQPVDELGSRAAELILELMAGDIRRPIREELQDTLILRDSVGAPARSRGAGPRRVAAVCSGVGR